MIEYKKLSEVAEEVKLLERRMRIDLIDLLVILREILGNNEVKDLYTKLCNTEYDAIDALADWKCIFESCIQTDADQLLAEQAELDFSCKPDYAREVRHLVRERGFVVLAKILARQIPEFAKSYIDRGLPEDEIRGYPQYELVLHLEDALDDKVLQYLDEADLPLDPHAIVLP